jgi:NAD(P)-dependent dehydrogenase (short-subunit alcohol dehydrogenase family)
MIGKATAQALAAMGSTTVLVAHDHARGETSRGDPADYPETTILPRASLLAASTIAITS